MRQVLDVPPTSPLFGYLAPGDIILSVDNAPIRNAQEWLKLNTLTYDIQLKNVNISRHTGELVVLNKRKGYCVPSFVMDASKITELLENQLVCPNELTAFVKTICSANSTLDNDQIETDLSNRKWNMYCLNTKDIVKLSKCGDDLALSTSKESSCTCPQVGNYLNVFNLSSLCLLSCSRIVLKQSDTKIQITMPTECSLDIFLRTSFV